MTRRPPQLDLGIAEPANQRLSFSGHETFVFRYGWLKKAVDAIERDPGIFNDDSAIVALGVGKNMVRSIRHWGLATGVLSEEPKSRGNRLGVSSFGRFLFGEGGKDPYLEDPNSLWLLHWNLFRQDTRATTWSWAFGKLPSNEFTRDSMLDLIRTELRQRQAPIPSEGVLKRDVDVFVRTYAPSKASKAGVLEDSLDCPLVELHLIEESSNAGHFRIRRGPKPTLSDQTFVYTLLEFWEEASAAQETLAFNEIAYRAGSPGSVFKLDENNILDRLERLELITEGALTYVETAGIRQVYRSRSVDRVSCLENYYTSSFVPVEIGG